MSEPSNFIGRVTRTIGGGSYPFSTATTFRFLTVVILAAILWTTRRGWYGDAVFTFYPLLPLEGLRPLLPYFFYVLLAGLVCFCFERLRLLQILWICLFAVRFAIDTLLWQPYYLYFAGVCFGIWLAPARKDRLIAINTLLLACLFFWSGVSKGNHPFFYGGFATFMGGFEPFLPDAVFAVMVKAGYLVPLAEILIALGLLMAKFRRKALVAAGLVQVLILLNLILRDYNLSVWFWNIFLVLVILFSWRADHVELVSLIKTSKGYLLLFLIFGVAPLASYVGLWPRDFSFHLYAYNYEYGYLLLREDVPARIPYGESVRYAQLPEGRAGYLRISLIRLFESEVNLVPPENRAFYKEIGRRFRNLAPEAGAVQVLIRTRGNVFTGERREIILGLDGE